MKPDRIATILDLADIASPILIPLVRGKSAPDTLTQRTLKTIAESVPNHKTQEAIARKIISESIPDADVKQLIIKFITADTADERQAFLASPWNEPASAATSRPLEPAVTPDQERAKQLNEVHRIEEVTRIIEDIANLLPDLPVGNHPQLQRPLDRAITRTLGSIARYQGRDAEVVASIEGENENLINKNRDLQDEIRILTRRIAALGGIAESSQRIQQDEANLRKD